MAGGRSSLFGSSRVALPQSAFAIAGTILAPVLRSGCDQTPVNASVLPKY
jgi:hypothetical protein